MHPSVPRPYMKYCLCLLLLNFLYQSAMPFTAPSGLSPIIDESTSAAHIWQKQTKAARTDFPAPKRVRYAFCISQLLLGVRTSPRCHGRKIQTAPSRLPSGARRWICCTSGQWFRKCDMSQDPNPFTVRNKAGRTARVARSQRTRPVLLEVAGSRKLLCVESRGINLWLQTAFSIFQKRERFGQKTADQSRQPGREGKAANSMVPRRLAKGDSTYVCEDRCPRLIDVT
jgi:hypothetical protein